MNESTLPKEAQGMGNIVFSIFNNKTFHLTGSDSALSLAANDLFGHHIWWEVQVVQAAYGSALWYAWGRYDQAGTPGGVEAGMRFATHYKIVAAAWYRDTIGAKPSILDYFDKFEAARKELTS